MKRIVVILSIVLSAAVALAGGTWTTAPISQQFDFIQPNHNIQDYGCSAQPNANVLAGFVFDVTNKLYFRERTPSLWWAGINTGFPPDHDRTLVRQGYNDIMRLVVQKFATLGAGRPRILFSTRSDVFVRVGLAGGGNRRLTNGAGGCDPGTESWDGTGRNCTVTTVPMCNGGDRDHYWCPSDLGDEFCRNRDGTITGHCELVPLDLAWVMTVPATEHAAAINSYRSITASPSSLDPDFICDGGARGSAGLSDFQPISGYASACGVGYPNNPTTLPVDSIGYALYHATGNWPLLRLPAYFINPPNNSCVGGTNANVGCSVNGDCNSNVCGIRDQIRFLTIPFDMRIEALRWWDAAQNLDKAYWSLRAAGATIDQIRSWPIAAEGAQDKPGWWPYYDNAKYTGGKFAPGVNSSADAPLCPSMWANYCIGGSKDNKKCTVAGDCPSPGVCTPNPIGPSHMWDGPVDYRLPWECQNDGGPLHVTQYGPGEYENSSSDLALKILQQTTNGRYCAATSQNPFTPCTTNSQCTAVGGGVGVCELAIDNFFKDVKVQDQDTPAYRARADQIASPTLQRNQRWLGGRRGFLDYADEPYATEGELACNGNVPIATAGGPYQAYNGKVRLVGTCRGAPTVSPSWTMTGCTGCTVVDPIDGVSTTGVTGGMPNEAMPLLLMNSNTNDTNTVTLTCDQGGGVFATSVATITKSISEKKLTMTPASPDSNVWIPFINGSGIARARAAVDPGIPLYIQGVGAKVMQDDSYASAILTQASHPIAINMPLFQGKTVAYPCTGPTAPVNYPPPTDYFCGLPMGGVCAAVTPLTNAIWDTGCQTEIANVQAKWGGSNTVCTGTGTPAAYCTGVGTGTGLGHLQSGDYIFYGNEQNDAFETGKVAAGHDAQYHALIDNLEAKIRVAVPGIQTGEAFHHTLAGQGKIETLRDTSANVLGLTVYEPQPAGHDCADRAGILNELTVARNFTGGLNWAILETNLCTNPTLHGSAKIQDAFVEGLMNWLDTSSAIQAATLKFASIFILLDGVVANPGCTVPFGAGAAPYICTLGLGDTDMVPKPAALRAFPGVLTGVAVCGNGKLNWNETCDDGNTTPGDGCNATCTGP